MSSDPCKHPNSRPLARNVDGVYIRFMKCVDCGVEFGHKGPDE